MQKTINILLIILLASVQVAGQEVVAPLEYKGVATQGMSAGNNSNVRSSAKATALSLPFIEDFTQYNFYPDTINWISGRQVYVNNNMCSGTISRGVATFDALAEDGLPYDKNNKSISRYADTLTSQPIDLSNYTASDSLYFSFFYQPEGKSFDPQSQDSLMLYFRRANASTPWTRVWRVAGSTLQPFIQVMVPITDASFFNADFQFRFVNKASVNNTNDTWNIDYIRLGANRNMFDTALQEVAFVDDPGLYLNDYAYMPYHQYLANATAESATQQETSIRNNGGNTLNVNYGYTATEPKTGTTLGSGNSSVTIPPYTTSSVSFPVYNTTVPAPARHQEVVYENKYYLQTSSGNGLVENDTIIRQYPFHNYLAYDDGTPEKSYYLKMLSALPAKLAIEHRLNVPDTITGVAIYFGRQVPLAYQKYFSLVVYTDIAYNGGGDVPVYQEDLLVPSYLPGNNFWYYKFRKPISLNSGKFYIGTVQPALGTSDSLYFGLDVNRTKDNHVFFNVESQWKKSNISGAVMIRPVFGNFFATNTGTVAASQVQDWDINPNPASNKIRFYLSHNSADASYTISDVQGRVQKTGTLQPGDEVDISALNAGMYIAQLRVGGQATAPRKFIKI